MPFNAIDIVHREQYEKIQKMLESFNFTLRLKEVSFCEKTREPVLHIVVKENQLWQVLLSQLLAINHILFAFNVRDIEEIIALKVRYLLPSMIYIGHIEEDGVTFIQYKDKLGNVFLKKIEDINQCENFISQFSVRDAYLLGHLLGYNHFEYAEEI